MPGQRGGGGRVEKILLGFDERQRTALALDRGPADLGRARSVCGVQSTL